MVNKKTATRELSKQTEHDQTMYVMKQYILIEEMVLRTIPAVLKKGNRKMVVNTPLILIKRASAAVTSRRIKWAQWNTIDNACSNGIKVNE